MVTVLEKPAAHSVMVKCKLNSLLTIVIVSTNLEEYLSKANIKYQYDYTMLLCMQILLLAVIPS